MQTRSNNVELFIVRIRGGAFVPEKLTAAPRQRFEKEGLVASWMVGEDDKNSKTAGERGDTEYSNMQVPCCHLDQGP